MTTNLKERFAQIPTYIPNGGETYEDRVLAFIKAELLALAEEVRKQKYGNIDADEAYEDSAALIRSKADEI